MAAGVLAFTGDLALELNSSFQYTLIWQDQNGNPIDLTNYQAKMQVGNTLTPSTVYATLSSQGGSPEITINGPAGTVTLTMSQSQVQAAFGTHLVNNVLNAVYDLLLYPPEGNEFSFLKGPFQVVAGVTSP